MQPSSSGLRTKRYPTDGRTRWSAAPAEPELKLRQADAVSIAADVVRRAEHQPCALLLLSDGRAKIVPMGTLERFKLDRLLERNPRSLVGTYDIFATVEEVAADVMAMGQSGI